MKTYLHTMLWAIAVMLTAMTSGCVNNPIFDNIVEEGGLRYSTFDYVTTYDCEVTIQAGRRAYVNIYTENPSDNPTAEPRRTAWTEANGLLQCRIHLPKAMIGKKLYATIGDETFVADITKNGASLDIAQHRAPKSRMGIEPTAELCMQLHDMYQMRMPQGSNNLDRLEETGEIAIETMYNNTDITFSFVLTNGWNSNTVYYYYYKGDDPVTLENRDEYIAKFCQPKFCCTAGWQVRIDDYFKVSPPAGHGRNVARNPYTDVITILTEGGDGEINCRFHENEGVIGLTNHLAFYGDDYEGTPSKFPKGYKIGFILRSVMCDNRNDADRHTSYRTSTDQTAVKCNYYFSNPEVNIKDTDGKNVRVGRFWTTSEEEEENHITRMIYGFEDSFKYVSGGTAANPKYSDHDYNFNDFVCVVSANPQINVSRIAQLTSSFSTAFGTLLYEDLFPQVGDYDMNDVITEYRIRKELEGTDGIEYIKDMYIDFAPVHYGATLYDQIYVQCYRTDGTLLCRPQLVDFVKATGMDLAEVAEENKRRIDSSEKPELLTVRIYLIEDFTPAGGMQPEFLTDDEVSMSGVDPFLLVNSSPKREVHLTGFSNAGLGSTAGLTENQLMYRAIESGTGFYPWALNVPMRSAGMHNPGFIPVSESINIGLEYLQFGHWVSSNGNEANDWYQHYNKYEF